jgi:hypothetical protein
MEQQQTSMTLNISVAKQLEELVDYCTTITMLALVPELSKIQITPANIQKDLADRLQCELHDLESVLAQISEHLDKYIRP